MAIPQIYIDAVVGGSVRAPQLLRGEADAVYVLRDFVALGIGVGENKDPVVLLHHAAMTPHIARRAGVMGRVIIQDPHAIA